MALEKFERLEEGLGRLLAAYEALSAENREILASQGAKDNEVAALRDKVARLEKERDQVRERVDGLLAKLETLMQGA
ncbi:MAG: cell division protein ZapB [Deltaproteobacteria bacterium]|nr:cell division protein ZapB [Deltaproteobacteria bacterium]